MARQLILDRLNILSNLINRNEFEKDKIKQEEKIKFPFIVVEFPEIKAKQNVNKILTLDKYINE